MLNCLTQTPLHEKRTICGNKNAEKRLILFTLYWYTSTLYIHEIIIHNVYNITDNVRYTLILTCIKPLKSLYFIYQNELYFGFI